MRPITLIYGRNSSGKSTLVQSLGLLKQSIESFDPNDSSRPRLALRGELVDLGSFLTVVHKHSNDPQTELSVGVVLDAPSAHSRSFSVQLGFRYDAERKIAEQSAVIVGRDNIRLRFEPRDHDRYVLVDGSKEGLATMLEEHEARNPPERDVTNMVRRVQEGLAEGRVLEVLANGLFPAVPTPRYLDNPKTDAAFGAWFGKELYDHTSVLTDVMDGLSYLGPMRAAPARIQELTSEYARDVGTSGEHVARLLADDKALVKRVNRWLEHLEIDYEVAVEEISDGVGDAVLTWLTDTRSRIPATPRDVGYGISQLLPVIVELLAREGATICIEQPEVHIHPRLQARLTDLIIESASARANQVIVETHSEHLMLRLQARIRHNTPSWLTSEKVAVLYVDVDGDDGTAAPAELSMSDSGDFIDEWPGGFFAERLEELTMESLSNPFSA